jgi:hypothetical protein
LAIHAQQALRWTWAKAKYQSGRVIASHNAWQTMARCPDVCCAAQRKFECARSLNVPCPSSIFLFERDLRANASRLSRGKTRLAPTRPSGSWIMLKEDIPDTCKKKTPVFRGDKPANNGDNPLNSESFESAPGEHRP